MIKGTVVFCGGACNLNCVFCPVRGERAMVPASQVKKAVARAEGRVILAGGDPLLRKDILEIIASARSRKLKVTLATNGRLLLYGELRRKLLEAGVDSFIITPLVRDELSRTNGAFVQMLAAARELQRLGVAPTLRARAGDDVKGVPVSWYYQAGSQLALERAPAGCEGLPVCLMGKEGPLSESATCLGLPRPQDYHKPLLCSECSHEATCSGVPDKSFTAVRPAREVRSNSFEYTFARALKGFHPAGKACRGVSLLKDCPPLRAVYLKQGAKLSLYTADTRSFTEAELGETKFAREQLYLDISKKAMLDDCQNDVRQLAMLEVCRDCRQKQRCGVAYGVLPEVPFEREERWLRQEIRRLSGRVLDIGCGDLHFYRDTVAKLLDDERIEYHGLDVDAKALKELKRSHPQAHVHKTPIEAFSYQPGYFDYIFALRSLNHFQDLEQAFTAMTRLLKDYGMLIMAECVPFGLLRTKGQTARARGAKGPGWEHYRNWSSEQVLEFVRQKGFSLKLNTHRPVRPGTSNQWLLKFIKIG